MTELNDVSSKRRLRLTFAKKQPVKYISHLDLVLAWERALRRAGIPLVYSQGYNPRPKIQVASGLPLGTTGSAEIMDIIVSHPVDPAEALTRISAALPVGLAVQAIEEIPLKAPTLQHLLRQADYQVVVETQLSAAELNKRIEAILTANSVIQTRQRKKQTEKIDLRPWLHELRLEALAEGQATLSMRLTAGQFGNLRPEEIIKALGLAGGWAEIERIGLIFEGDPRLT